MRICVFVTAFVSIYTTVECLPKTVRDDIREEKYLDLVRQINEAVEKSERGNGPPYIYSANDNFVGEKSEIHQAKSVQQNENDPTYSNAENTYIDIVNEVVDAYMKERTANDQEVESAGIGSATEALRSFNRPSSRIKRILEQQAREEAAIETLLMIASADKNSGLLREISVPLSARSAKNDPSCDTPIDCNTEANKTIVDRIEFRNIDGICNNLNNYTWGMTYVQHRRLLPDTYHNGKWHLRRNSVTSERRNDVRLPSARHISNIVHSGDSSRPKTDNDDDISLALFYFMQFIDHDLAKTPEGHVNRDCCKEDVDRPRGFCLPIKVEVSEDHFDLNHCMDVRRSFTLFRCNDRSKFQNQINEITSFLDASMVYGSTFEEEKTLRLGSGGWLKEGTNRFLPNSSHASSLPCNTTDENFILCFEAGDTRANVHPALTSYHTIFVREHNRIAKHFGDIRPRWSDERIYQETRKIIGAQIQHIVYSEMLPILFREDELDLYNVSKPYLYNSSIDASMTQAFSMAYRYHQLMPNQFHLAEEVASQRTQVENFEVERQENVFQRPHHLIKHNFKGLDEIALGLLVSKCPYADRVMNDATRNLLFLDKNGNSLDLAALNIMRGREWGMPTYTSYRTFCGLGNATTWDHLLNTTNRTDIDKLKSVYADVRDIDLWTGLMTERPLAGTVSGPTQTCLLAKHFANIKHGDRFWYENPKYGFNTDQLKQIQTKTLARVLCDNLGVTKMRPNVFRTNSDWVSCSDILKATGGKWDLSSW